MSFSYVMSYFALLLVISHLDILIVWLVHLYSKHTTIIWFILCSRTYALQCYMWTFFTVWISIENLPSELMQVRPQLSRSNCKNRETSVSLPGMTGILLISLLSSFLSLIHHTHHHFSCRGSIARHLVFQACKSVLEVTAVVPVQAQQPSGQTSSSQRDLLSKSPAE